MGGRRKCTVLSDLAFGLSCGVFVLVHKPGCPLDANWKGFLDAADAAVAEHSVRRMLVHAEDVAPTASQRSSVAKFHQDHATKAAILTNSVLSRAAVTAIGWFAGSRIKAFATANSTGALDWLDLPPHQHTQVLDMLELVARELGLSPDYRRMSA